MLFFIASCSSGDGSGGGESVGLAVELAFIPMPGGVTVEVLGQSSRIRQLNVSEFRLTAIDAGDRGSEEVTGTFDREDFISDLPLVLTGLTDGHRYIFSLMAFYYPFGSDVLSNVSVGIIYHTGNAEDAEDGIAIGPNRDEDHLADLVDADDDNDGLNDLDSNGMALDRCPRGDIGWQSGELTDNDGDGCRDAGEDKDDDNDGVADAEDLGRHNGRLCRLFADCDEDSLPDAEDLGVFNGERCRIKPDCDNDGVGDLRDNCMVIANPAQTNDDGDELGNACDPDADGDGLIEIGTAAELDAVRWALNGNGRRRSEGAPLDQIGCGNGDDRTACNGYELVRDISLAAYASGSGWAPLGNGTVSGTSCQGAAFGGVFDGNDFTVRGLNINRSEEDCIGLFGNLAVGAVVRNLMVDAEIVIGRDSVGGLVGWGAGAEIVSSHSVVGEVRGNSDVGGLVGYGDDTQLVSSHSVVGEVRGDVDIGGLVGHGNGAEIAASSSVAGEVRGGDYVGGLVGNGGFAQLVSSYSVVREVRGDNYVAGLVGDGNLALIISSYSVVGEARGDDYVAGLVGDGGGQLVSSYSVAGEVRGDDYVAGLVGNGDDTEILSSYSVAGGGNLSGLAGSGDTIDIYSSYWNVSLGGNDNGLGEGKTLAELRMPTNDNAYDTSSIYADWPESVDIDAAPGDDDITIYCDNDLSGEIEAAERQDGSRSGEDDNRIWDFGGTDDYPAIRCTPGGLDEQRSWWFINTTTNRPQLDQTRLDALLP